MKRKMQFKDKKYRRKASELQNKELKKWLQYVYDSKHQRSRDEYVG